MSIRVKAHDWSRFIQDNLFAQVLLSAIGVLLAFVALDTQDPESLLVFDPALTAAGFVFAFTRVWITIKEEAETCEMWGLVDEYGSRFTRFVNLGLETFWVLTIVILPFTSIAVQLLLIVATIFYLIDFVYNHLFLRALRAYYAENHYSQDQQDNCPFQAYFRLRNKLTSACGCVTLFGGVLVWSMASQGRVTEVVVIGLIVLIALTIVEAVLGMWLTVDFHFLHRIASDVKVRDVELPSHANDEAVSQDPVIKALDTLYEKQFSEAERYTTIAGMLRAGCRVVAAMYGDKVVGLAVYEVRRDVPFAFLWYLAIDDIWQERGFGTVLVRKVLGDLAHEPASIRYAMFEVGHHMKQRRRLIRYYRRLGAYRLRGLDYVRPASNPSQSLRYDVMFFVIAGEIDAVLLKQGVQAMIDDAKWKPNDGRRRRLIESLDDMFIQPPDAPASDGEE